MKKEYWVKYLDKMSGEKIVRTYYYKKFRNELIEMLLTATCHKLLAFGQGEWK